MKLKRDEDFDIIDLANTISMEELCKLININSDRISVNFGQNKVQFTSGVYDASMNGAGLVIYTDSSELDDLNQDRFFGPCFADYEELAND
tara:strand:+ start:283 stop:555 length:273 start_codon:yes stop_codon:yes gene_type:complete